MQSIGLAAGRTAANEETRQVPATVSPRVISAAHEFEAQMMKELLKPLTDGEGSIGDDDQVLGSGNALGEFASETLGRAISDKGGLGIAGRIVQNLAHRGGDSAKSARSMTKD